MSNVNNSVTIKGNIGQTPTIKEMPGGGKLALLSIATNDRWQDEEGKQQQKTHWHKVAVWDQDLVAAAEKMQKGSFVSIVGRLENQTFDKEGKKVTEDRIVVRRPYGKLEVLARPISSLKENQRPANDLDRAQPHKNRERLGSRGRSAPAFHMM